MKHYFEVVVVWDGELFAHTCATLVEAFEWAEAYSDQLNCAPRIWRI
jgi:hypothetical protein